MSRRTDLPPFKGCTACGECCTTVSVRPDEAKRIRRYMKDENVTWSPPEKRPASMGSDQEPNRWCGFLRPQDDGTFSCAIYPVRPWGCRAFGVVEGMPCSYGPEEAVNRPGATEAVLLRLTDPFDPMLGEVFEPGYVDRMKPYLDAMRQYAVLDLAANPNRLPLVGAPPKKFLYKTP